MVRRITELAGRLRVRRTAGGQAGAFCRKSVQNGRAKHGSIGNSTAGNTTGLAIARQT
jgi:hypothetical protein